MYTRWAFKNKQSDEIKTLRSPTRPSGPVKLSKGVSFSAKTRPSHIKPVKNNEPVESPKHSSGPASHLQNSTTSVMRMESALLNSTRGDNFAKIAERNPLGWTKIVAAQLEHEKFLQSMHFYDHGPLAASTRPSFKDLSINHLFAENKKRFRTFQIPWRKRNSDFISPQEHLKISFDSFRKGTRTLPRTPPNNDDPKSKENEENHEILKKSEEARLTRGYVKNSMDYNFTKPQESIMSKLVRIDRHMSRPPPYKVKTENSVGNSKPRAPANVFNPNIQCKNLLTQAKKLPPPADEKQPKKDETNSKNDSVNKKESNYLMNKLRFGTKYGGKKPPVDESPVKAMQQKFLSKEQSRKELSKEFGELVKSGYFGTLVSSTASSSSSPESITPKSNAPLMLPVSQLLPVCISSPYKRQTVFIRDYIKKESEATAAHSIRQESQDTDQSIRA